MLQTHAKFRPETQHVMRFSGRHMTHGSAIMMRMRANKIQVNPRIYVKDFIGNPDKMAGGHFSGWSMKYK